MQKLPKRICYLSIAVMLLAACKKETAPSTSKEASTTALSSAAASDSTNGDYLKKKVSAIKYPRKQNQ